MNQPFILGLFYLVTLLKHLYLNCITKPQLILERLIGSVNNNQAQPRFYFYKFLY